MQPHAYAGPESAYVTLRPGHFDALMLNIATLLAVFWAPDYYLFSDYVQSRGADPSQHVSHLQVRPVMQCTVNRVRSDTSARASTRRSSITSSTP